MTKPRPLLDRLLSAPDVSAIVPRLQPEVLHRVIQRCGLEDCAELVALATPGQLARVLDADVWRPPAAGRDEAFDADRFGVWLDVLLQCGEPVALEKLAGLDIELVIAGFASHVTVFDYAAVAPFTTLDGDQTSGRPFDGRLAAHIGGYVIVARRTLAWEAIVDLLASLDAERPGDFHRLMRGCVQLSNGAREIDGLDDLLDEREQDVFDLMADREARRDDRGYVAPAQARAFLEAARNFDVAAPTLPRDPVSRAYFRTLASQEPEPPAPADATDAAPPSRVIEELETAMDVLREAGVVREPRALLGTGEAEPSRLPMLRAHLQSDPSGPEVLAYLANTLVAGAAMQGRPFTPEQASDVAAATCNLGLERWPAQWPERDLIAAFQVGWRILHRDVCVHAAERLIAVIADLNCSDREIQMQLVELRRELTRHLRDGMPWRARDAFDVIMILDTPSWAALLAMIDECPTIHAAAEAGGRRARHSIDIADVSVISHHDQMTAVRDFLDRLPSALTI